jgi:hypothetical protein
MVAITARRARWYFMSYGMGAESTAWLHRILFHSETKPAEILPDYSNLIVGIAQTGDEWSKTGELVTAHILPLLRRHRVRLVEVARRGPTKADGVEVLQDSREPYRLHLDGAYKLSHENRESGTMPIRSGHHTCAQKSKGEPLDWWRGQELGDETYFHAIGYNVLEQGRIRKDAAYSMGGQRIPTYPVSEWGMTREDCLEYLKRELGIDWIKSSCRQCPYINRQGWPEQLKLFNERPEEAVPHLVDERVTLALNPRCGLYGPGRSLWGRLRRDGATHVLDLADRHINSTPWAIYRIRRRYKAPAIAPRSVQKLIVADRRAVERALAAIARLSDVALACDEPIKGAPKKNGEKDAYQRLWLRRRNESTFPSPEEFLVAAPAQANDKALATFEHNWTGVVDAAHLRRSLRVGTAITWVATSMGDERQRDPFGVVEIDESA